MAPSVCGSVYHSGSSDYNPDNELSENEEDFKNPVRKAASKKRSTPKDKTTPKSKVEATKEKASSKRTHIGLPKGVMGNAKIIKVGRQIYAFSLYNRIPESLW
jgi:hypothetical protein